MTSIQGLLVGYLLRKNLNTNISNKKHSRSRHCWQKRFFNADRLPDTFLCNSETTPGGTAFQRVFCKETTPSDRLILYFHGGSYIAGLSPVYRNFAPSLSAQQVAARSFIWIIVVHRSIYIRNSLQKPWISGQILSNARTMIQNRLSSVEILPVQIYVWRCF